MPGKRVVALSENQSLPSHFLKNGNKKLVIAEFQTTFPRESRGALTLERYARGLKHATEASAIGGVQD
jgi:hypothetical protein